MNAKETLDDLSRWLDRPANTTELHFVAGRDLTGSDLTVQHVQLRQRAAQEFRILAAANVSYLSDADAELVPWDPGFKPDARHRIIIDLNSTTSLAETVRALIGRIPQAPIFKEDEKVVADLRMAIVSVGTAQQRAGFFTSYTRSAVLGQSRKRAITRQKGQYDQVTTPIFTFNERFDFVTWHDYVFVIRPGPFNRLVGDQPAVVQAVRDVLDRVHGKVPIANVDEFVDACQSQPNMRLKALGLRDLDYLETITVADIKEVSNKVGLDLPFEEHDGKTYVRFETAGPRRFKLLNVLNDDYMQALLTARHYEANSKIRL